MLQKDENFRNQIRNLRCVVCGRFPPNEVHHIKTRGAGGGDDWWNLIPLCSDHHTASGTAWHKQGSLSFLKMFPHVYELLQKYGWSIVNEKLIHENSASKHVL